jgi:general stress protein YciG
MGKRGFGSMDPEKQRSIASMGGRAAHAKGTAHVWTAGKEAVDAGRKGGAEMQRRKKKLEAEDNA